MIFFLTAIRPYGDQARQIRIFDKQLIKKTDLLPLPFPFLLTEASIKERRRPSRKEVAERFPLPIELEGPHYRAGYGGLRCGTPIEQKIDESLSLDRKLFDSFFLTVQSEGIVCPPDPGISLSLNLIRYSLSHFKIETNCPNDPFSGLQWELIWDIKRGK